MPSQDHYAILQVHPEAETIVIEAAYRRLAREYHPDVNESPGAHERMVAINEAFQVLSDPKLRLEYDQSRGRSRSSGNSQTYQGRGQTSATQVKEPQTNRQEHLKPPPAPNPRDFGIEKNYFDRAVEGALEWQKRRKAIPPSVAFTLRIASWLAFLGLLGFGMTDAGKDVLVIPAIFWIGIPVVTASIISAIEDKHDKHLRKAVFDPKYNPNPEAYNKFATEQARHDIELSTVYVPRSGCRFHTDRFCGNMNSPFDVQKYVATAKGYTPCSRCGYLRLRPRSLPSPFGSGPAPQASEGEEAPRQRIHWPLFIGLTALCALLAVGIYADRSNGVRAVASSPDALASSRASKPLGNSPQVAIAAGAKGAAATPATGAGGKDLGATKSAGDEADGKFTDVVVTDDKDANTPKSEFKTDTPKIFVTFKFENVKRGSKLTGTWICEKSDVAPPNFKIDEPTVDTGILTNSGDFSLSKPTKGWPVGSYRTDLSINGKVIQSVKFTVVK